MFHSKKNNENFLQNFQKYININGNYNNFERIYLLIEDNNKVNPQTSGSENNIIKKVEIYIKINKGSDNSNICNDENNNCYYYIYYKDTVAEDKQIYDITFDIKFLTLDSNFNINVFKKSGNPGYIIGSPIRFGQAEENTNNILPFYRNKLFLGLGTNGECNFDQSITRESFYENLILSNSITFENRTLYACLRQNANDNSFQTLIQDFINYYISSFGNPTYLYDDYIQVTNCQITNNYYIVFKFFYQFVGLKQNPQRKIIRVECEFIDISLSEGDKSFYLEFLFISLNNEVKKKRSTCSNYY